MWSHRISAAHAAEDSRGLVGPASTVLHPTRTIWRLIVDARADRNTGIDPKLKLMAQRAYVEYWKKHFETNEGIKTGCEVLADDRAEPVIASLDGLVGKHC